MSPPLVVAMFVVFTLVGALVLGVIGAIGGAGAAFMMWTYLEGFQEALQEDREREERGEGRTPLELAFMIFITLGFVAAFVGMILDRAR